MPAWVNPTTHRASCPDCGGFRYHEDDTDEGRECETCGGSGVATKERAEAFLRARDAPAAAEVRLIALCKCTGEQLERGEHCDHPDCPNRPAP